MMLRCTKAFLILSLILLGMVWTAPSALAQNCNILRDEIITLRPPAFQNYTIWDHVHGEDGMEQIADFLPLEDGSFVAAGSYTTEEEDKIYKPYLFRMDKKGKPIWETRETPGGFQSIDRIIEGRENYIVIGDIKDTKKGDGIYMATYSQDGKRIRRSSFFDPKGDLDSKAIVRAQDGNGYFIAAQLTPFDKSETGYGVIYKVTSKGKQILKRGFSPGLDTVFNNMQPTADGNYFITGSIRSADGRRAGWLLKMDNRGSIVWQRTYPRGAAAELHSATGFGAGGYFITGNSTPAGGNRPSGWVAGVDTAGNIIWQRYFFGPHSYSVWDGLTYPDGRSVALLRGMAQKLGQRTHVRLLTFSPRGQLINAEEYSDFNGATAFRLYPGYNGERLFAGYTQSTLDEAMDPTEVSPRTFDAWIVAVEGLEVYDDPCAPQAAFQ